MADQFTQLELDLKKANAAEKRKRALSKATGRKSTKRKPKGKAKKSPCKPRVQRFSIHLEAGTEITVAGKRYKLVESKRASHAPKKHKRTTKKAPKKRARRKA